MTGSSTRNAGSGSGLDNNGRGSLVKDILMSASRRLLTSPLHLSVFSASGTRSEENILSTHQRETAFVEHVSARTPLLVSNMSHTGRLRTFSLTMDVSSHDMKDLDSGNSSLIDSGSADSYQEFSSGNRSETNSSSKSDQSLTSANQIEFQVSRKRSKHSSLSDSINGSLGKISLNTSDITENSEESLTSTKNDVKKPLSSTFFSQDDKDSESHSQPFLCLPSTSSDHCLDCRNKHKSSSAIRDNISLDCECVNVCCDFPSNEYSGAFSSTVININPGGISREASTALGSKRLENADKRSSAPRTTDDEHEPLLMGYETKYEHEEGALSTYLTESCKHPIRRSSSMGNISRIHLDEREMLQTHETVDPIISPSPAMAVNSDTTAATSISSFRHQHTHIPNNQSFNYFNSQPYCSSISYTPMKLESSPTAAHPTQICSLPSSEAPECSPARSSQLLPQYFQNDKLGHPCLNDSCISKSPYLPKSRDDVSRTSDAAHVNMPHYNQLQDAPKFDFENGSCSSGCKNDIHAVAAYTAKNPVKNLKAVLGYGTPVFANALKQGTKSHLEASERPLQVLVPRVKETEGEINRVFMTKDPIATADKCQDRAYLANYISESHHLPHTDYTRLILTPSSLDKHNNSSHPEISSQDSPVYPVTEGPKRDSNSYSFKDILPEQCPQYLKKGGVGIAQQVVISNASCGQIYFSKNQERVLSGPCDNVMTHTSLAVLEANKSNTKERAWPREERFGESESGEGLSRSAETTLAKGETKSKQDSLKSDPKYSHQGQCHYSTNNTQQTQLAHIPDDQNSSQKQVPSSDVSASQNDTAQEIANQNLVNQPCILGQLKDRNNQKNIDKEIGNDSLGVNNAQVDDNGYRAGMIVRVPKDCFVANFFDSCESLSLSERSSLEHSLPSSVKDSHAENNDGSQQSSYVSQLGLLKSNISHDSTRIRDYSDRDCPDYKYLCFVATALNPVLGLLALICNHYAQKNLHLHRRRKANNLYFATIATSTVAIFLTLIAGAMLVANNVVLRGVRQPMMVAFSAKSCENALYGFDDDIQNFYNLDVNLYCEITKKSRVMEALKRFWVEHWNNKEKHGQQRSRVQDPGISKIATLLGVNATDQIFEGLQTPGEYNASDFNTNDTTLQGSGRDLKQYSNSETYLADKGAPVSQNSTSNSTAAAAGPHGNPVVPTERGREYRPYLRDKQRTKVHDDSPAYLQETSSNGNLSTAIAENRSASVATIGDVAGHLDNSTKENISPLDDTGHAGNKLSTSTDGKTEV